MTVQEFYAATDCDYEAVFNRLLTDERIKKFVLMFFKDVSYNALIEGLENGNVEDAFRAAHTMKGTTQNISLSALYEPVFRITEVLRAGDLEGAKKLLPDLVTKYEDIKEKAALLAAE